MSLSHNALKGNILHRFSFDYPAEKRIMIIAFVGGQRTKREQAMRNTFPSELFTFSVGFGMRKAQTCGLPTVK
jgi:hypothetical protein